MRILRLKEHHGDVYLDISTDERFAAVALSIINGRFGGNNPYYYFDNDEPDKPLSQEQIEALPEGSVKHFAFGELSNYTSYTRQKMEWERAERADIVTKEAIEKQDPKLAIQVLKLRSKYEDEGYEIINVLEEYPSCEGETDVG